MVMSEIFCKLAH